MAFFQELEECLCSTPYFKYNRIVEEVVFLVSIFSHVSLSGFVPNFLRLSAWNICMFVCFEQFKRGFTLLMMEPTDNNNNATTQKNKAKPRPMT